MRRLAPRSSQRDLTSILFFVVALIVTTSSISISKYLDVRSTAVIYQVLKNLTSARLKRDYISQLSSVQIQQSNRILRLHI